MQIQSPVRRGRWAHVGHSVSASGVEECIDSRAVLVGRRRSIAGRAPGGRLARVGGLHPGPVVAHACKPVARKARMPVSDEAFVPVIDGAVVPVGDATSMAVSGGTHVTGSLRTAVPPPIFDMDGRMAVVGVKEVVEAEPVRNVIESVCELGHDSRPGGEELDAQDHQRDDAERRSSSRAPGMSHGQMPVVLPGS